MAYSLSQIAKAVNGEVRGDNQLQIKGAATLEEAENGDISFLSNLKYLSKLEKSSASAILIDQKLYNSSFSQSCVVVDNVYESLASILEMFSTRSNHISGDQSHSFIAESSQIGEEVHLGPFSIVEDNTIIGDRSKIFGQVYLGHNVTIGKNCIIYPGVKICDSCLVGDNVIIHANAVVGSDGFGFAPKPDGTFQKIPQIGNVIIENDVEIGANVVIDRASMGSTIIRTGTKLDNLIQVAHNVDIGRHNVIAAQAGIAGSTKIGNHCQIGGQVGIVGHIEIGDQTMIQAQSGMTKSVKEQGTKWYGSPAIEYNNYLKSFALYKNLPDLQSRISKLEKLLAELQHSRE